MDHIHCHSYNDGCSVHTQSDFYNIANSNICDILSKSWNQNLTNNTDTWCKCCFLHKWWLNFTKKKKIYSHVINVSISSSNEQWKKNWQLTLHHNPSHKCSIEITNASALPGPEPGPSSQCSGELKSAGAVATLHSWDAWLMPPPPPAWCRLLQRRAANEIPRNIYFFENLSAQVARPCVRWRRHCTVAAPTISTQQIMDLVSQDVS